MKSSIAKNTFKTEIKQNYFAIKVIACNVGKEVSKYGRCASICFGKTRMSKVLPYGKVAGRTVVSTVQ